MAEEQKPPEASSDTAEVKTVEQVIAELKATNSRLATLEKQNKDKEEMIGRQSTEIGELRKKVTPETPPTQVEDEEVADVANDFKAAGLDPETATFNAKLVVMAGRKRDSRKVIYEAIDIVQEQIDEGKLPEFEANQAEIMEELKNRKLAPTARRTAKILRDCYEIVIRRKADKLKGDKQLEDEKSRTAIIDKQTLAPGSGKTAEPTDATKFTDSIKNAGPQRSSVFF